MDDWIIAGMLWFWTGVAIGLDVWRPDSVRGQNAVALSLCASLLIFMGWCGWREWRGK